MGIESVLVDRARISRRKTTGVRREGRSQFVDFESGTWFPARLFLPASPESRDPQRVYKRVVIAPTLMYGLDDDDGTEVDLRSSDYVEVESEDLGAAVWEVTGDPEPFRKKEGVIGHQVTLKRLKVEEPRLSQRESSLAAPPVVDSFNRADGPLGPGWRFGDWSQTGIAPQILNNQVAGAPAVTSCVLETVAANAVSLKLAGGVTGTMWLDLYLVGPLVTDTLGYLFSAYHLGGVCKAQITPSMGSSFVFPDVPELVAGDEVGFSMNAGLLSYYVHRAGTPWELVATATDPSWDNAPSYLPGFACLAPLAVDDFRAGEFTT